MPVSTRVFVDSNVLASRTLRDWLFQIRHRTEMFQLHSTPDVLAETLRAWRRRNPKADGKLIPGLEALLRRNLDEVLDDFSGDVEFTGKDPDDHHVHAAALHSHADILLTDNPSDFGEPNDLPYDLYTADEFLCLADDGAPHSVRDVVRAQNKYWQGQAALGRPTKPLTKALEDAGCPEFAGRVEAHLQVLSGS